MKRIIKIAEGDSYTHNGIRVFRGGGLINDDLRFKDATIEIDEQRLIFSATMILRVKINIEENRLYGKQELLDIGVRESDIEDKFHIVKTKVTGRKGYISLYQKRYIYTIYHLDKFRFKPIKMITSQPFTICGDYEEVTND